MVLDYCLHVGSENVVRFFRDNIYVVKTLMEFQYIDEDGKDQGANVRQKAMDITNLLQDESRLRQERHARAHMRDRMIRGTSNDPGEFDNENRSRRSDSSSNPSTRPNRDEEDLRKAIEESKKSLAEERVTAGQRDPRDLELELAIQMNQKEEDQRKKQVAESASSLFVKAAHRGYSDAQVKVRAATSNDPWGPSSTQMNDIAQMTYNQLSFLP